MAITRVASSGTTGNENTISFTWPSVANNDVAVIFWRYRTNLGTVTGPSGWTLLGTQTTSTDACRVYWKVCTGSESGSIDLNVAGTAGKQQAVLTIYRGVDVSGASPIHQSASLASTDPPAVTTTVADCAILTSLSSRDGTVDVYTPPSGYSALGGANQFGTTGGGASTIGAADSVISRSSGSVNPGAWSGGSSNNIVWTVALAPGAAGTNYNETATALAADASLGNVSGVKSSSTGSGSLGTSTALSGAGSAAASASVSLDAEAGVTATGTVATTTDSSFDVVTDFDASGGVSSSTDADAVAAGAALTSSGVKGASSDADTLSTDVSVSATGTAAANATAALTTEASTTAAGNADTAASSELPVEASLTSDASAASSSDAALDLEIILGPLDSGAAFLAAVSELSGSVDVTSSGTAAASTPADELSVETSSDSTPWVELFSASNLYEVLSLFNSTAETEAWTSADNFSLTFDMGPAESFLGSESTTIFSTVVELESDSTATRSADVDDLATTADFPIAATESGPTASANPLTFSVAVYPVANADTYDDTSFPTLMNLETSSPSLGARSESPLQVESEYGTATVTRSVDFSILVKLSLTQTSIPDPLMDTEIDFLDMETLLPNAAISTVVDDPATLTEVPAADVATSIDDPLMDTEIDFLDVDTLIDDPETSTEIPSPGITTSANGA